MLTFDLLNPKVNRLDDSIVTMSIYFNYITILYRFSDV